MEFEVDTERLTKTVTSLQAQLAAIEEARERILSGFDNLNGMWEGKAHDAFQERCQENNQRLKTLCQDVSQIIEDASQARIAYDNCENSVRESIARIHI